MLRASQSLTAEPPELPAASVHPSRRKTQAVTLSLLAPAPADSGVSGVTAALRFVPCCVN